MNNMRFFKSYLPLALLFYAPFVLAQDDIERDISDDAWCIKIAKSSNVPKKIDGLRELISVKCESTTYLHRPTITYTYKVIDNNFEQTLRKDFDSYRRNFFWDRCRNTDGTTSNRLNFRAIYVNRDLVKIADLIVSYYECFGAYNDKMTGGLGAESYVKLLESTMSELKATQKDYIETNLSHANSMRQARELLEKYMASKVADDKSAQLIRILNSLANIGAHSSTPFPATTPALIGQVCYFIRDWTSGMNRNCVYSCMGSETVNTIRSNQSCSSNINK